MTRRIFEPHHVGMIKSEAARAVGSMGFGHGVAVGLSEARVSQNPRDSLTGAVIDKHGR